MQISAPSNTRHIFTPTKLNRLAKTLLQAEIGLIWLSGEISNFTAAGSGHWYFTLKDNRAQIRAAMFKQANFRVATRPKEGDKVLIRASVSLYEPRGDYQLIVEHLELDGEGALKQEFELLKQQLEREGLFDASRKRPLPRKVSRIGVITSSSGAALHDVLSVLSRRAPDIEVIVYPSLVQGEQAPQSLRQALFVANQRQEVDVLLITRGGGSMEDLWAFNNAGLARDIASSAQIVVSAVGHEVDITICDFVADTRAPTPSAAAELISPEKAERLRQVVGLNERLEGAVLNRLRHMHTHYTSLNKRLSLLHPSKHLLQHAQRLDLLSERLTRATDRLLHDKLSTLKTIQARISRVSPNKQLVVAKERCNHLEKRMFELFSSVIETKREKLKQQVGLLNALSPLSTLTRGYTITLQNDRAVTHLSDIDKTQPITTRFQDGELISKP